MRLLGSGLLVLVFCAAGGPIGAGSGRAERAVLAIASGEWGHEQMSTWPRHLLEQPCAD
jgi:hypothetical protein